jgi:hypothetical protein
MPVRLTRYGFEFGAANVIRAIEHKGYVQILIATRRRFTEVNVTPSGLIRCSAPRRITEKERSAWIEEKS